jgi:hypothetical protein
MKEPLFTTWFWEDIETLDQTQIETILDFAKDQKFGEIYLNIEKYEAVFNGNLSEQSYMNSLNNFIILANERGIGVNALVGNPNYSFKKYHPLLIGFTDFVFKYNKKFPKNKFMGLSFDLEYYNQHNFRNFKTQSSLNFLSISNDIINKVSEFQKTHRYFKLSFAIPFWLNSETELTPKVEWNSENNYVGAHLIKNLNRINNASVIIMAYRSHAIGPNGTIEISLPIIKFVDESAQNIKVLVGQETAAVGADEAHITFLGKTFSEFSIQKDLIIEILSTSKSFGGIAINSLTSFKVLSR